MDGYLGKFTSVDVRDITVAVVDWDGDITYRSIRDTCTTREMEMAVATTSGVTSKVVTENMAAAAGCKIANLVENWGDRRHYGSSLNHTPHKN